MVLGRLGAALAKREAIDAKEFFESCEFYLRTRRRVRQPLMCDLACGHGLTGLLFAAFEVSVEHVVLVDQRKPRAFEAILDAVTEVAPWAAGKVTYVEGSIADGPALLCELFPVQSSAVETVGDHSTIPPGKSSDRRSGGWGCLGVHACGAATDAVLEAAEALGAASVAVMPCCYTGAAAGAPRGVRRALGIGLAADVGRSYRLEDWGFATDWAAVPREVTPMNRILVGERRRKAQGSRRQAGAAEGSTGGEEGTSLR